MNAYRKETILKQHDQDNNAILHDLLVKTGMSYHERLLGMLHCPTTDRQPTTYNNLTLA